ncbi:MAG: pitrilysin family protein [Syntrophobacteraceae bacterium]|nr:pitrilysin family protein [Syntrophobacteraceae bacterium]
MIPNRTVLACILVPFFCLGLPLAALSFQGGQCPFIPPQSQSFVDRTIASKPGDLFVVLKNGLTLLVHQMSESGVVSAQVFVRTGSVLEGKYMRAGLSHYLEHIVVSGSTRSMTEEQAKERLEAIGGSMNAYTSYDRTVFHIDAGADHWRDVLDILLSKVTENLIAVRDIDREKNVIQQEMKMRESNPGNVLWELFLQTAYRKSPVRYPVVGFPHVFVKQDREALLDYYRLRYQPQNMIVAVAGNVAASEVLQLVAEKTRNFVSENSPPVVVPLEPAQASPRWEEKTVPITRLTRAMIGFPSVDAHDHDLYALDVLAQVMGEGETCRLYCSMKEKQNKVFGIEATNWTPAFVSGQFIISASMSAAQWPSALTCIENEIASLKDVPIGAAELAKAKNTAIAQHIFQKESVESMASSLASSYDLTGNPYYDDHYLDRIRAVTARQVQDAARRYLVGERMNVAVIKPPSTAAGKVAAVKCRPPEAAGVAYSRIGNGLKLLIKKDKNLPIVTLQLWGKGGLSLETVKNPGISVFTAALLTAGTKTCKKIDLMKKVEDVGGEISAASDYNSYHVSIKVLKGDFGLGLRLLADIAQNASFPPDQIAKQKQDTLTAIKMCDENWRGEAMRLFMSNYFHKTPYANYKLGTIASVNSFTRDQIVAFYRKMVNPTHSVLAIYGDVDPREAARLANRDFGKWTGEPVTVNLVEETHPLVANRTVEIRDEKSSSALMVGTNGLGIGAPERPVLDVLTEVLSGGGSLSGRMFDSLRGGDKDLIYTVSTFPFYGVNSGFLGVLTQTTMANLPGVQKIIEQNLDRLKDQLVPESELARAKDALLVGIKFEKETIESRAGDAALDEVLGLGWNYTDRYPALVKAVTARQVEELARRLFTNTLVVRTLPERPAKTLIAPPATGNDLQR